jgi:hypothetical protein
MAGLACFDNSVGATCYSLLTSQIRAVSCGGFSLWELPPATICDAAYCLDDVCGGTCALTGACTAAAYSSPGGCTCAVGWSGELCETPTPLPDPNTDAFLQAQPEIGSHAWVTCFDSAVDDASTPAVFHTLCDPFDETVTIADNSLGFTFGGYVSVFCCTPSIATEHPTIHSRSIQHPVRAGGRVLGRGYSLGRHIRYIHLQIGPGQV